MNTIRGIRDALLRFIKNSSTTTNNNSYSSGGDDKTEAGVSAQQGGVVLNFTDKYNTAYATENGWTVLNGTDLASGLAALQAYTASGKTITNLIIHSHGVKDGRQIHLGDINNGGTNLDAVHNRTRKLQPEVALMNQLLGEVAPGGTVVFTGCNAALILGQAMATNIRCDIKPT